MKLNNDMRVQVARRYEQFITASDEQESAATDSATSQDSARLQEEPAAVLELSFGVLGKDEKNLFPGIGKGDKASKPQDKKGSGINDSSGRLTKMLVSAKSKAEVQAVLSQAYHDLGEALKSATGGDQKAMDVVRRLHKLIRRANRKFKDLTKEEEISRKQKKAKKDELEQLAKQLEEELKRKIAMRKQREKKYLNDPPPRNRGKQQNNADPALSALEAKLRMLDIASKSPQPQIMAMPVAADGATEATSGTTEAQGAAPEAAPNEV